MCRTEILHAGSFVKRPLFRPYKYGNPTSTRLLERNNIKLIGIVLIPRQNSIGVCQCCWWYYFMIVNIISKNLAWKTLWHNNWHTKLHLTLLQIKVNVVMQVFKSNIHNIVLIKWLKRKFWHYMQPLLWRSPSMYPLFFLSFFSLFLSFSFLSGVGVRPRA